MKRIILLILIIVMFAPLVSAFDVNFKNTTNKTLVYRLYWLAPEWLKTPEITAIAVGELKAGKKQLSANNYEPGPYVITWENLSSSNDKFYKSYPFDVEKDKCTVISTPNSKPVVR